MKKLLTTTVMAASLSALAMTGCSSTTSTGAVGVDRQQLLLVSNEQVLQLSAQSYAKTLQEAKARGLLDTNSAQLNRLKISRTVWSVKSASIVLMRQNGNGKFIPLNLMT